MLLCSQVVMLCFPFARRPLIRARRMVSAFLPKFANLQAMATPGKAARSARPANESALLTSRDNRWLKEFRMALRNSLSQRLSRLVRSADSFAGLALRAALPGVAIAWRLANFGRKALTIRRARINGRLANGKQSITTWEHSSIEELL